MAATGEGELSPGSTTIPATPEARRERLLVLLRQRAVKLGDFTLASGRKSHYYIDGRLVTLDSEGSYLIARCVLDLIARERIDATWIGGLTMGADPIAAATAAVSHAEGAPLSAFLVRKEAKTHGTGRKVEGGLPAGARVVIVDDVVTTAGSTLQAIAAAEEMGCEVAAVICVIDREEGGREALRRHRFYPLFVVSELVAGMPLAGAPRA
jgi:orotate phosphoribosyltransferase